MGWPQWLIAILLVLQVLGGYVLHGREREPWNYTSSLFSAAIMALLLHAGGFWQ